jgi:Ca-activated chloride channel family protein
MTQMIMMNADKKKFVMFPEYYFQNISLSATIINNQRHQRSILLNLFCYWLLLNGFIVENISASIDGALSKSNRLAQSQKNEEALNVLLDAAVKHPGNDKINFNLGNSFYRLNNFDEAIQSYQQVIKIGQSPYLSESFYNLGNAYFRQGKLREALAAYEKTLQLAPNDEDAKFNLELVKREIKRRLNEEKKRQEEQKKSPPENKDSETGKDETGKMNSEKQQEDRDKKETKGKSEENGKDPGEKGEKGEPAGAAKSQKGQALSKEEANQLLNAVEEDPKKFSKKRIEGTLPAGDADEKDW